MLSGTAAPFSGWRSVNLLAMLALRQAISSNTPSIFGAFVALVMFRTFFSKPSMVSVFCARIKLQNNSIASVTRSLEMLVNFC